MGKIVDPIVRSYGAIRFCFWQNPSVISSIHVDRFIGYSEETFEDECVYVRYCDGCSIFPYWRNIVRTMQKIYSMLEHFESIDSLWSREFTTAKDWISLCPDRSQMS